MDRVRLLPSIIPKYLPIFLYNFVFFLQSHSSHDKLHPKGDVVLENPNVIECITKLAMIFIETQKRELQLQFKTE